MKCNEGEMVKLSGFIRTGEELEPLIYCVYEVGYQEQLLHQLLPIH